MKLMQIEIHKDNKVRKVRELFLSHFERNHLSSNFVGSLATSFPCQANA